MSFVHKLYFNNEALSVWKYFFIRSLTELNCTIDNENTEVKIMKMATGIRVIVDNNCESSLDDLKYYEMCFTASCPLF